MWGNKQFNKDRRHPRLKYNDQQRAVLAKLDSQNLPTTTTPTFNTNSTELKTTAKQPTFRAEYCSSLGINNNNQVLDKHVG